VTVNFGLRWDAQYMPETVDPKTTAYGFLLSDPRFPSDGTIPDQKNQFQPRLGIAWDLGRNGKSVIRANAGVYYARQNMLSQVGSVTTNGLQQKSDFVNTGLMTAFGAPTPTWPNILPPSRVAPGTFPFFTGVRVFAKDYENPRIYSWNAAYEQELLPDWSAYVDFTWSKAVHLTRFLNYNAHGTGVAANQPPTRDTTSYSGGNPFEPQLGDVFVANSRGKSLYRGGTLGIRKRFSHGYQLEANYVLSKDMDDDSNERDPFTDRTFNRFDFNRDYSLSDRDIKHKFNFYTYAELPGSFQVNVRMQARSAQPITVNTLGADGIGTPAGPACSETNSLTRIVNGIDCGRNHLRKNNEFFSFDWRVLRPFKFGDRYALVPMVEMFNTFNNDNNINPLVSPGLFNFDGFLREGVGDPRQLQLAVKFTF